MIVKVAPPASLMVALAGLGFTYLGIGQLTQSFAVGHLGMLPLGVALVGFFGDVKMRLKRELHDSRYRIDM